jgi:hypothetical protein
MTEGVRSGVSGSGYPTIVVDGEAVYVHRLSAVAECGLDAVRGRDVHHVDGNPFNSGRDNLRPLDRYAHRTRHLRAATI